MQRIQKTISEFLSDTPVPSVGPDDRVTAAVESMKSAGSDCTLVIDDGKLLGIFTERDFLNRVAAAQRDPGETAVRDVMTAPPETLHAVDCISYAINRMAVRGYRNVPIVNEDGAATAVISVRNVIDHMTEVFDEIGERGTGEGGDEWVDIGGGA